MKTVYRIENSEQIGLYCVEWNDKMFAIDRGDSNKERPTPYNDTILRKYWNRNNKNISIFCDNPWHFGFISWDQLFAWMGSPEFMVECHNIGLKISQYEVADRNCRASDKQAMFIIQKAKKVAEFNLNDMSHYRLDETIAA